MTSFELAEICPGRDHFQLLIDAMFLEVQNCLAVSTNWNGPFSGVLRTRALLFGVYNKAPNC